MAELDISTGKSRKKKSLYQQKKQSTKVDLTPMVDLGFLLITFFMVTTAWTKPHATNLFLPADGKPMPVGQNASLTLLAGKDDKIFYYHGDLETALHTGTFGITNYSIQNGIGNVIRQKQLLMDKNYKGGRKELVLIIKISEEADYKNVVGLLDEMLINNITTYALVDINAEEKKLLKERIQ